MTDKQEILKVLYDAIGSAICECEQEGHNWKPASVKLEGEEVHTNMTRLQICERCGEQRTKPSLADGSTNTANPFTGDS